MSVTPSLDRLQGLVRRGEFIQAIREAEGLLLLTNLSTSAQARVLKYLGRCQAQLGDFYGAVRVLETAHVLARNSRDWDCLGLARAELGIIRLLIGDYSNAIDVLQTYFLDLEHYTEARAAEGLVQYNLGLAHRRRRDYRAAIERYTLAVSWFIERGYTLHAGQTHQNIAWVYCLDGNYDEAERELTTADSFLEVCGAAFQAEQLVCRALYYHCTGQIGTSMLMVEEVLRPTRTGVTATHKGHATWIAGCNALRARHYDMATYFADLATQYALEAKEPAIMSQASLLRADIAKWKGEGEAAG